MSKPWVVICGLIRDEAHFAAKLDTLRKWKADGEIEDVVLSTWIGEVDRSPAVAEAWARDEFILVESDPPPLKTVGHTVHQARSLYYALQAVPDGKRVLKDRPDMSELTEPVLRTMQEVDLSLSPSSDWPEIFQSKIVVSAFCIDSPLYINDIHFFGLREDLLKLANFDLSTEFLCNHMAPEQFFYRGAFSGQFPLLEAYFQVAPHFLYNNEEDSNDRVKILLASDAFLDALAFSLRLMRHYFRVGFIIEEQRQRLPLLSSGFDLADLLTQPGTPGTYFNPLARVVSLFEESTLDSILQGRFARNSLGRRMMAALKRVSAPNYVRDYSANPLSPSSDIRKLQAAVQKRFPFMGDRLADVGGDSRRIRVSGPGDRIGLVVETDETRRQAEEINHLRRVIDQMQGELPKKAV